MLKNTLIIALVIALIYLYYQQKKTRYLPSGDIANPDYQQEVSETISDLRTQLNQAQSIQIANERKLTEQTQTIRDLQTELRKLEESSPGEEPKIREITELEDERDELKRENLTLEQEITARGNQIRNKNKEVENKNKEIRRITELLNKSETNVASFSQRERELEKKYLLE